MATPNDPADAGKTDYFISYTGADGAWAEWVASELERAGYSTVFQGWDFRPGNDFIEKMREAVAKCARVIAIFSPAYFESGPAGAEINTYLGLDWGGADRRVIPVLVAPVPDRDLFQSRIYIDISKVDEQTARERLLAGLSTTPVDRTARRIFPGATAPAPAASVAPFPRGPLPPNNLAKAGIAENPGFVGRTDELARLHAALAAEQTAALTQALVGDGGFGKTEIARAYLFHHGREYAGLWWVDASAGGHDPATEQLARKLEIAVPDQVGYPALRREIVEHLSQAAHLLVLDNVDDPAVLRDWRVQAPARRLITTRRHGPELGPHTEISVDVLPAADARALLAQHRADLRPEAHAAALEAIAAELGHHALAVALAGAWLGQHVATAPAAFLQKLRDERSAVSAEVLREMNPQDARGEDYARSVFATLALHLGELTDPAAERLLAIVAFLHPEGIDLDLLTIALAEWSIAETEGGDLAEQLAHWQEAVPPLVEALTRRSIVQYAEEARLHRLTQRMLRARLDAATQTAALRAVLVTLTRLLDDANNPAKLTHHATFIPHAEAALALAKITTITTLTAEAGELALRLGNYAQQRADFTTALGAFIRAEEDLSAVHGPGHPQVAVAVNNRGSVLEDRGDLDAALACYAEAERIGRMAFGDDHPSVAIRVNNRGCVLRAKGDLDAALACYAESERIGRKAFGDDHPNIAVDVNNRGEVLRAKGDLDAALACYVEAERIGRTAFGDDHPNVAIFVNNRGLALRAKGDLDAALACYAEAERICQTAFGEDHPQVAPFVNNRGSVLLAKGNLDGARACYRESFSIVLRRLGPRAGNTLVSAGNLMSVEINPLELAVEIAGPEVAAQLQHYFREYLERQRI